MDDASPQRGVKVAAASPSNATSVAVAATVAATVTASAVATISAAVLSAATLATTSPTPDISQLIADKKKAASSSASAVSKAPPAYKAPPTSKLPNTKLQVSVAADATTSALPTVCLKLDGKGKASVSVPLPPPTEAPTDEEPPAASFSRTARRVSGSLDFGDGRTLRFKVGVRVRVRVRVRVVFRVRIRVTLTLLLTLTLTLHQTLIRWATSRPMRSASAASRSRATCRAVTACAGRSCCSCSRPSSPWR